MGGNDFIRGSALTSITDSQAYAAPVEDKQPLRLTLKSTKESYLLGTPVEIEVKLSNAGANDRLVIANINPRDQFVQLAIRNPAGIITEWRPLFQYCVTPTITT
jgi:hypothetical protein